MFIFDEWVSVLTRVRCVAMSTLREVLYGRSIIVLLRHCICVGRSPARRCLLVHLFRVSDSRSSSISSSNSCDSCSIGRHRPNTAERTQ